MADVAGWGPYRAVHRLGEGGMGVVHLAVDPHGRSVAVKALRPAILAEPAARRRLAHELEALRRLRHPRIAKVLDADLDADVPYLVTEFVPGPTLDAAVAAAGPLSPPRLRMLGTGLLEALTHLHDAGIVHRDVKPANVVLRDDAPVLIDFGIARLADASRITSAGLVVGTPGYLPPEAATGGDVDERADWWGWAATLAFAATGRPPFGQGPVPVLLDRVRRGEHDLDGVPRPLRDVLVDALAADPRTRPGPRELLDALQARVATSRPAPVPPTRVDVDAATPACRPVLPATRVAPSAPTVVLTAATALVDAPLLDPPRAPAPTPDTGAGAGPGAAARRADEPERGPADTDTDADTDAAADAEADAEAGGLVDAARAAPPPVLVAAVVVASALLLAGGSGVAPWACIPAAVLAVWSARFAHRLHAVREQRAAGKGHGRLGWLLRLPGRAVAEVLDTASAATVPVLAAGATAWSAAELLAGLSPGGPVRGHLADPAVCAPAVGVALLVAWLRPDSGPLRSGARLLAAAAVRSDRRAAVALACAALALVAVTVCLALRVAVPSPLS